MHQIRKLFSSSREPARRQATSLVDADMPLVTSSSKVNAVVVAATEDFKAGRLSETLAVIDHGLAEVPGDATLLFARGSTLLAWGRYLEALEAFRCASEAGLAHFDLDMQFGWTYMRLNRAADAEAHFQNAVSARPDSEHAWIALANALETRGVLASQAKKFVEILSRWPQNYDGVILLAACRAHAGDQDGSTAEFRRAVELDPTRSRAWSNLGVALGWREQYDEGLSALRRAFAIDQANGTIDSLQNLATSLREKGHFAEAMDLLDKALIDHPDPNLLWLRSVMLLESARFDEAWVQHEFRWMREPLASVRWTLRRPVWDGQDLDGKTIMLHAEQGFGDAIQFIRYARVLKERGARVIFDAFRNFAEISNDFEDVDEVAQDGAMPAFDYHIPLLGLPRVFGTMLSSIPAHVPYVRVRPERSALWGERIGRDDKLKVGLVWAGNPKHLRDRMRSISLSCFAKLARIDGVQLYSLQKGDTAVAQIASSGVDLIDLGRDFNDFCDTAAAISHLDLVISVDTSVAHLAGALGKPVWTMIAEPADWRWLTDGDRTAWYPTMRLFRQRNRNRWEPVVEDVHNALQELTAARRSGMRLSEWFEQTPATGVNVSYKAPVNVPSSNTLRYCGIAETRYGIVQYSPKDRMMAESLRYYGEHLQPQLALMARFIRPGGVLLEVATGIGINTLFMAECVGAEGHVIAYEPDRYFHQIARQNLAANRVKNVTLLRRSVAAECVATTEVPTDTIDALRLSCLGWIRINTTANCAAVLRGAQDTLWRLRPWLFVSADTNDGYEACKEAASEYGYQSRPLRTPLFNPENYNRRSDDIFIGASRLALICIPEEIDVDMSFRAGNTAWTIVSPEVG